MKRNLSDTIRWINESITKIGLNSKVKKKFDKVDAIDNISDYVDLGLPSGNMWAKCNVGATSEEEYGDYFSFDEANSQYSLPSTEDYKELIENTSCELGKKGVIFTSIINGKSILLPLSGHCDGDGFEFGKKRWAYYWTSTEYNYAYRDRGCAFFTNIDPLRNTTSITKYTKTTIRTISKKKVNENLGLGLNQKVKAKFGKVDPIKNIDIEFVDLGLPSGNLWAKHNVGATSQYEPGKYFPYISDLKRIAGAIKPEEEIPSASDYTELLDKCSIKWDDVHQGIIVTSKTNGNEIFFKASGFKPPQNDITVDIDEAGYYWTCNDDGHTKGKCFAFDYSELVEVSRMVRDIHSSLRTIIRQWTKIRRIRR